MCVALFIKKYLPTPNSKGATPEGKWPKNTPKVNCVDVRIQLMLNFETEMWLIILWYGLPQIKMDKNWQIKYLKTEFANGLLIIKGTLIVKVPKIYFCVNKTMKYNFNLWCGYS